MADEVGICNSALIKIGATEIVSLTDGSRNANLCLGKFSDRRDFLLSQHNWNFAIKRAELAQLSEAPAFGFDHAYRQPADLIRLVSAHDNDAGIGSFDYRLENDAANGNLLATNADQVWIRYVRRVTDPNQMPVEFREVLAADLAAELAVPIANSRTLRDEMLNVMRSDLRKARSIDALQDQPEAFPDGSWVAER